MKALMMCCAVLGLMLFAFVPAAGAQSNGPNNLVGTQWQLESYGTPGAETPVISGSNVSLQFETADQLAGSGGCNSYGGNYMVQGNALTVSNVVSTLMACADNDVNAQEQTYLAALGSAQQFDLVNDRLIIHLDSGQQLAFVRTGQESGPGQVTPQIEHFEDLDSPVGLLASYYNAISRQDYQRAYSYWETPPDPFDQFVSGFADTESVQVIVQPPTRYGGAAGSLYVDIPTVLIARHTDGEQLVYAGCFVTRTSNLMPPDIPEEDVWHLYSADLVEVSEDSSIPALLAQACPAS